MMVCYEVCYNGTKGTRWKSEKKSLKVKSSTNNVFNPRLFRWAVVFTRFPCAMTCTRIIFILHKDFVLIWWCFAWISRISSASALKSDYTYMLYWCTQTYSVCKTSFNLETLDTGRVLRSHIHTIPVQSYNTSANILLYMSYKRVRIAFIMFYIYIRNIIRNSQYLL